MIDGTVIFFCSNLPIAIKHVKPSSTKCPYILLTDISFSPWNSFISLLWKEGEPEKDMGNVQCSYSFISEEIFNNQYTLAALSELKRIFTKHMTERTSKKKQFSTRLMCNTDFLLIIVYLNDYINTPNFRKTGGQFFKGRVIFPSK